MHKKLTPRHQVRWHECTSGSQSMTGMRGTCKAHVSNSNLVRRFMLTGLQKFEKIIIKDNHQLEHFWRNSELKFFYWQHNLRKIKMHHFHTILETFATKVGITPPPSKKKNYIFRIKCENLASKKCCSFMSKSYESWYFTK